jgi:hypothetical protein
MQAQMQELLKTGWGLRFAVQLPPESNAHYAGRDVKLDAPDRPIFWYRPAGAEEYRVIRADLSVNQQKTPPDVSGAVRLTPASKPGPSSK